MANDQASYRTLIDDIIATAVDSSTWTTAIKDESLRQALAEYDERAIYEDSFTVVATAETQDLSTITALNNILAVAYPWTDGADFQSRQRPFRTTEDQVIYFEDIEPVTGEDIRVRYTIRHAIKDLDSAAATTVPVRHTRVIGLLASSHACMLRIRQVGENPAIPAESRKSLEPFANYLRMRGEMLLSSPRAASNPNWNSLGL